jgi:ribosomal protein L7/L12
MVRCPQCDHFNIEGAAACERCGAALATAAAPIAKPAPAGASLEGQVVSIAATGGKIAAIKWYREQTGQGLKESKDAVEALLKKHNVAPKSGCGGMVLLAISVAGAAVGLSRWASL